jgi:hypothetical protein
MLFLTEMGVTGTATKFARFLLILHLTVLGNQKAPQDRNHDAFWDTGVLRLPVAMDLVLQYVSV